MTWISRTLQLATLSISDSFPTVNPLGAKLNPFCHLLALLEAHHILHVSRIRVKPLTDCQSLFAIFASSLLTSQCVQIASEGPQRIPDMVNGHNFSYYYYYHNHNNNYLNI